MIRFLLLALFLIITGCSADSPTNGDRDNATIQQPDISKGNQDEKREEPDTNIQAEHQPEVSVTINEVCNTTVLHWDAINLDFVKKNIQFGVTNEDVLNFWGNPCGIGENPFNGLTEWRYDFTEKNYIFVSDDSGLSQYDDEGLKNGNMKFQLALGWIEGKLAYYSAYYVEESGADVSVFSDAPEEFRQRVFD